MSSWNISLSSLVILAASCRKNRQTNRQTGENLTPTTAVGVGDSYRRACCASAGTRWVTERCLQRWKFIGWHFWLFFLNASSNGWYSVRSVSPLWRYICAAGSLWLGVQEPCLRWKTWRAGATDRRWRYPQRDEFIRSIIRGRPVVVHLRALFMWQLM